MRLWSTLHILHISLIKCNKWSLIWGEWLDFPMNRCKRGSRPPKTQWVSTAVTNGCPAVTLMRWGLVPGELATLSLLGNNQWVTFHRSACRATLLICIRYKRLSELCRILAKKKKKVLHKNYITVTLLNFWFCEKRNNETECLTSVMCPLRDFFSFFNLTDLILPSLFFFSYL